MPAERRTARYRTVIVVALADGAVIEAEGACEGVIADAPAGSEGFGYDPIFFLPSLGKTMAELSTEAKNRISHRALAVANLKERLRKAAAPPSG